MLSAYPIIWLKLEAVLEVDGLTNKYIPKAGQASTERANKT